jgi:hypothetical protein
MEQEHLILEALWRWKLITTAALSEMFFPQLDKNTAYKKIVRLEKAGLIQTEFVVGGKLACAWTLTRKGFLEVSTFLPSLQDVGYKSETLHHDWLATAFHLGAWLKGHPESIELFTEQELRRLPLDLYPSWVPNRDIHRPDGYSRVQIGSKNATIAIEVELSRKRQADYEILGRFYEDEPKVSRVLWLVPSIRRAHSILERIKSVVGDKCNIHHFCLLPDFKRLGWQAPLYLGYEQGSPVAFLMGRAPAESPQSSAELLLLRTGKSYKVSETSFHQAKSEKCYRVAYRTTDSSQCFPHSQTPSSHLVHPYLTISITPCAPSAPQISTLPLLNKAGSHSASLRRKDL